ncbi:MAG: hypothetical protein ABIH82_04485 [Candidatus Woesearchaeota archaeon]
MALSPKDIQPEVEARHKSIEIAIASLENKIDDTLRKVAPFSGEEVLYPLSPEIPKDIIARVISDYRANGWKVEQWKRRDYKVSNNLSFSYDKLP